ncbi:hypothetical protein VTN02DRAFT_2394 [Thermoascus thermophilus]
MSSNVKSDGQVSPVHSRKYPVLFPSAGYTAVTSKFEFEHDLSYLHYPPPSLHQAPLHYSQDSCSSIQTDANGTTPDLTPSSSFSSTYSLPHCPEAVLKATEPLCLDSDCVCSYRSGCADPFYLPATTPPATPYYESRPTTPTETTALYAGSVNASSETLIMRAEDHPASSVAPLRVKSRPSLPDLKGNSSGSKKVHATQSFRPQIDPSTISPPSLINPVTLEPHASHLDHAFFIPADDYPTPVPSPVATSPPITSQMTAQSSKGRPSTSASEAHCEQSVWESDSDTESIGRKSLSRRGPIETLRKVRSRVQLRVTKSGTKLNGAIHDDPAAEEPPPALPDNNTLSRLSQEAREAREAKEAKETKETVCVNPTTQPSSVAAHQTLRLVAPSTTSLPRPPSRRASHEDSSHIDTSTAAAIQAQIRRQQKSSKHELPSFDMEEKNKGHCYESHSDIRSSISSDRRGRFKRIWGTLRTLNCIVGGSHETPRAKSV